MDLYDKITLKPKTNCHRKFLYRLNGNKFSVTQKSEEHLHRRNRYQNACEVVSSNKKPLHNENHLQNGKNRMGFYQRNHIQNYIKSSWIIMSKIYTGLCLLKLLCKQTFYPMHLLMWTLCDNLCKNVKSIKPAFVSNLFRSEPKSIFCLLFNKTVGVVNLGYHLDYEVLKISRWKENVFHIQKTLYYFRGNIFNTPADFHIPFRDTLHIGVSRTVHFPWKDLCNIMIMFFALIIRYSAAANSRTGRYIYLMFLYQTYDRSE